MRYTMLDKIACDEGDEIKMVMFGIILIVLGIVFYFIIQNIALILFIIAIIIAYKIIKTKLRPKLKYPGILLMNMKIRKDFQGIYIIHNVTKNIYYVGQSQNVKSKAKSHINGTDKNSLVFNQASPGDSFMIEFKYLYKHAGGDFQLLNDLELECIDFYNAIALDT